MTMLRFVLRRAWHTRMILLPVLLGVLASVTVLCSVPLLARAAANTDLQARLSAPATPIAHNVQINFTTPPLDGDTYTRATNALTTNVQEFLGQELAAAAPLRAGIEPNLLIYAPDNHRFPMDFRAEYLAPSRSALWFHDHMDEEHLTLTAGRFPSPDVTITETSLGTAYEVEVMLLPEWATQLKLRLGQTLDLLESPIAKKFLRIHLVGFFHPKNQDDPDWFGDKDLFTPPLHFGDTPDLPPPPFWMSETAFHTALRQVGLRGSMDYIWFYYLNLPGISALNAQATLDNILALKRFVEGSNPAGPPQPLAYHTFTRLDELLQTFFQQQFFVTIATLIAALPGLALLLLYVALAAGALAERHRDEIALMKSRGASAWQVFWLSGLEALLLCGLALVAAPPLAGQLTHLLFSVSFFQAGGFTNLLTIPSLQTYLYAAAAALLCAVALLLPALAAARASFVTLKRSAARHRPPPLWLRLLPGALLTALGVYGYIDLAQRGAFFTRNAKGSIIIDWVASTAPTLLLLGAAGLSLLLLPPLLAALERIGRRMPGIAFSMAARQMARRPAPYTRLVLLLALTLALGVFASLFSGTLLSSVADRAAYQSGADLRLVEGQSNVSDLFRVAAPLADHLAALPGAVDGMEVFRATQTRPTGVLQAAAATTLAVDSARFERLASWREDFADAPLSRLMQALREPVPVSRALPALVDDRLLRDTGKHMGDEISLTLGQTAGANFVIVGTFHYFPTLDTSQYALVCDIHRLLETLNVALNHIMPNEVWLKLAPDAPAYATIEQVQARLQHPAHYHQVIVTIQQLYNRSALLASLRNDPLHFAISGALSLDFVVAALLSVVGFVVLFTLLAQRRAFEFGVLRALGLSLRQLGRALGWEQCTLVGAAVLFGGALGAALANVALPALATDQDGRLLQPPFALRLDVASTLQLALFLLACAVGALVATVIIFRRLKIQQVLRLGEE